MFLVPGWRSGILEIVSRLPGQPLEGRHTQRHTRLKRQVMGREVVVAVTKGKLDLGPWEQLFYGEFDGNRPKRVLVKVAGE